MCHHDTDHCDHCDLSVDVGPASMLVGNLVAGKRIAQATGRELGVVEDQDLIRKVEFATQTLIPTLATLPLHNLNDGCDHG